MLSIGFESISRHTLKSVHKHVNRPETFRSLVEKIHSYGMLVFGLFMFGFDGDDGSVFDKTAEFNIQANYDVSAYSVFTPYPGTLAWYEMLGQKRIVSYDWDKYDQGHIVYRPKHLTPEQLRNGHMRSYQQFYAPSSIMKRFPLRGSRSRLHWMIYNLFFRKGEVTGRNMVNAVAEPTPVPNHLAQPPLMPIRKDWQNLITTHNHY
jgi:radical SAM superfamily enzyme YgiQ (UPF0313 family)